MSIYDILLKIKDENLNDKSIYAKIIELIPEISMGISCYDQEQLFIYVDKYEEDYECETYVNGDDEAICDLKTCRCEEVYNCVHIIITNYDFIVSVYADEESDNCHVVRYYDKSFGKLTADIARNMLINSDMKCYDEEITLAMMFPKMTKSARK